VENRGNEIRALSHNAVRGAAVLTAGRRASDGYLAAK
jgi:hypothetical protein